MSEYICTRYYSTHSKFNYKNKEVMEPKLKKYREQYQEMEPKSTENSTHNLHPLEIQSFEWFRFRRGLAGMKHAPTTENNECRLFLYHYYYY